MNIPDVPKDGDFASYLEAKQIHRASGTPQPDAALDGLATPPRRTLQQVLVEGEEPTEEFLEDWKALNEAPELSDEELAQQALNAPGDDGDVRTPE